MELYPLQVFLTVATERAFRAPPRSCCARSLLSLLRSSAWKAILGEKLIDRSGQDLLLTDAGRIVLEYARRFENLEGDLENALAELRDNSAGRLTIGANESTTLYLLAAHRAVPAAVSEGEGAGAPQAVEQDSLAAAGWRSGTGRDQLRSGRRASDFAGDLYRSPGVHRLAAASVGEPDGRFDHGAGHGDVHRAQRGVALSRTWCCANSSATRCR